MKNIQLQSKNLTLFQYLAQHNFLTRDLIEDYVYAYYSKKYVNKRLWQLEKANFINKENSSWLKNKIYTLSDFSRELIVNNKSFLERMYDIDDYKNKNGEKIEFWRIEDEDREIDYYETQSYLNSRKQNIKYAIFDHNYQLLKARLILEKAGVVKKCQSESLIRIESRRRTNTDKPNFLAIPDLIFNKKDLKIAFELENSEKAKERLIAKFEKLYKSEVFDFVIYCTTKKKVKTAVERAFTSFERARTSEDETLDFCYITTLEDLKNNDFKVYNASRDSDESFEL